MECGFPEKRIKMGKNGIDWIKKEKNYAVLAKNRDKS